MLQDIMRSKLVDAAQYLSFTYAEGVVKYKGKFFKSTYDSYIGGHVRIQNTYRRLKAHFYWPFMKKLVQEIVQHCDICKQAKVERVPYPGLLQALPVPRGPWQDITMDFMEGLPRSEGKETIMVIVDRFTKYVYFITLAHPFTVEEVAKIFLDHIYKFHGLPATILTNRDKLFTSLFWRELFRHLGVKLLLSTSYHLQTDGQIERVNQCLETYLWRASICTAPINGTIAYQQHSGGTTIVFTRLSISRHSKHYMDMNPQQGRWYSLRLLKLLLWKNGCREGLIWIGL
jgi:transposase InsO family protein